MSIRNVGFGLALVAVLFTSCDEPKDPSYVWGTLQFSADSNYGDYDVNGSLATSGESYYGYCRFEEDGFAFAVGDNSPGQLGTGTFYEVKGISGSG